MKTVSVNRDQIGLQSSMLK